MHSGSDVTSCRLREKKARARQALTGSVRSGWLSARVAQCSVSVERGSAGIVREGRAAERIWAIVEYGGYPREQEACLRIFVRRILAIRTLYPTYICLRTFAYVLLAYVLFTVRTFADVHLRTYF